jgi:hypothetical protein
MSLYVRLNGLFMTLCHYMSGWMFHLWLCFHHLYEWMDCSSSNLTYNDIKSWTDHPTWYIMTEVMNKPFNLTYNDIKSWTDHSTWHIMKERHEWTIYSVIICQVEWSVHDFMSLYVRLNGLFMTSVIICQVEWSVNDFMSLYVRLNGLFMTLCHYMSGWMVHLWLCFRQTIHSDKKKDINSRTDHSFIQMMKTKSQMNHSTWHIMT